MILLQKAIFVTIKLNSNPCSYPCTYIDVLWYKNQWAHFDNGIVDYEYYIKGLN